MLESESRNSPDLLDQRDASIAIEKYRQLVPTFMVDRWKQCVRIMTRHCPGKFRSEEKKSDLAIDAMVMVILEERWLWRISHLKIVGLIFAPQISRMVGNAKMQAVNLMAATGYVRGYRSGPVSN